MENSEYLKIRTKGNASPQGKPRVYFTCNPSDFDKYFETVCEDIFKTQDCAIYYTADMAAEIPEEYRETDLNHMNLFVVPVTFSLLTTPNRAMDSDLQFALEKHIPVLPIMFETGIDEFYTKKFESLQYLSPYSRDLAEISYEEKLKNYLSAVLLDDKTAERVRAAFDAYIFLSYRKKDRKYANELMRLIHSNPLCRDIAIWYDEFLTPGESFSENIRKMLEKSDLFALLVTPNLVNEENYVQTTEYPAAREANKNILPAEMESTDQEVLRKKYADIPDTVNARDDLALQSALADAFASLAIRENDSDPAHNYLIGLAYLEGIDVEVNRERAVELISSAAEANLPEAMEKLQSMYHDGYGVPLNWYKAHEWCKRIADYYVARYGEKHPDTLTSLNNLAVSYGDLGYFQKALGLNKKVYEFCCKVFGETHPDTLESLNNLAGSYGDLGDYKKQLELYQQVYISRREVLGEKNQDTLRTLNNLAYSHGTIGNYQMQLELYQQVYVLLCEELGEQHPYTLRALNNLAYGHGTMGNYQMQLNLNQRAYLLRCETLGEGHPDAINSLCNIAYSYGELHDYKKALELFEKVYSAQYCLFGEKHFRTLITLSNLAVCYKELDDCQKALDLNQQVYALRCEILGKKHPHSLKSLSNLASSYDELGNHQKALELNQHAYELRCEVLGEKHSDTLTSLNNLASSYGELGDYQKAIELFEQEYTLRCEVLGEKHPNTQKALESIHLCEKAIAQEMA